MKNPFKSFIIPFAHIHFSESDFVVIGNRPESEIEKYSFHWLKKYSGEEPSPCFIFVDVKEKIIRKHAELIAENILRPSFYSFGDHEAFLKEIEDLYKSKPSFVYVHGFEKLFNIYSQKSYVLDYPETILIRLKQLTEKYKTPTIITTHIHDSPFPLFEPNLKLFGSTTIELIASTIIVLKRVDPRNVQGEEISDITELILLKGYDPDQCIYRFKAEKRDYNLYPAPSGS